MTAQQFKTNKGLALSKSKGFTLIELLVVIGILAILLAITLIAINPARQFGQANDTARRSAATQILNAIGQYTASNGGVLPAEITDAAKTAGTAYTLNATNYPNLCSQLVPSYLPALPVDPNGNDQSGIEAADCAINPPVWNTQYEITRDANNRITISAPNAYSLANGGVAITVTR